MKKEIILLQNEMKKEGITAYVVPSDDYHGSEYVSEFFRCREFLTGFTGSAGTLLVTEDAAMLWTDGRYFLQAEEELRGSNITLMKMDEKDVPKLSEKIEELSASDDFVLGFDGRVVSFGFVKGLLEKVPKLKIKADEDLVDRIWQDREHIPSSPVSDFDIKYAGKSRCDKLDEVREAMAKERADCLIISSLDDIAWLFNLRGNDVPCNPVFLAYAIVTHEEAILFADRKRFDDDLIRRLSEDKISVRGYNEIWQEIKYRFNKSTYSNESANNDKSANNNISAGIEQPANVDKSSSTDQSANKKSVWIDTSLSSYLLCASIGDDVNIIGKMLPTRLMKAVKNPVEMDHIRSSHLKDGIAETKFIYWLKHNIGKERITEISAASKLEEYRKQQALYMGPSFEPIVGYASHGAIIHYEPTAESDIPLESRGLVLIDTGGQYLDGTTDITRTVVLGDITDEEKRYFTLILKANLNLSSVRFKKGCTGMTFDYLARKPLWDIGEDYNHGTGHGVGFYLNVHEAPNGFRYKKVPEREDCAIFEEGMLTSNEPGYYAAGKFGIRHENLMLCVKDESVPGDDFLCFETVTLVPFDVDGIDADLLSKEEKRLLNDYHRRVREALSSHMSDDEREWLFEVTREI